MKYTVDADTLDAGCGYGFSDWWIALAKAPNGRGVISTLTGMHSCREDLCLNAARALRANLDCGVGGIEAMTTHDRRHINLIIYSRLYRQEHYLKSLPKNQVANGKRREASVRKALNVINSLEYNAGWPPTKIYRITEDDKGTKAEVADFFYYVKGSPKWLRAPSLLSLYGILLRSGLKAPVRGAKISSSNKGVFLKLQKETREHAKPSRTYLSTGLRYGLPFLQKVDVVFRGRTVLFNYGIDRFKNSYNPDVSSEGFQRLMNGTTKDKELYARVKKHIINKVKG